jgi:hypothetical protein
VGNLHSEVKPSCPFLLRIADPSPASSPPATYGFVIAADANLPLIVRALRAFMDTRLTALRTEKALKGPIQNQIDELTRMTVGQLKQKYLEIFGEESRSNHKQFLFRRIAWRIQAIAEGGLSERARRRALEIANDADLRIRAPRTMFGRDTTIDPKLSITRKLAGGLDPRLPPAGSFLERDYKGRRVIVKVLVDGFEFEGQIYRSLSAIAREVTGTKWNGFLFFNLAGAEEAFSATK